MLEIAICDNDNDAVNKVEGYLNELRTDMAIDQMEICIFYDGKTLVDNIIQGNRYDLIYLDIEMEKVDGIKAAKQIRKYDQQVLLIYITNYESYAKDLFDVETFQLILKPIEKNKFVKYFKKAYNKIRVNDGYFRYQFNKINYKVPYTEILYFQSEKRLIYIVCKSGNIEKCYGQLNKIEKQLTELGLLYYRIHQSLLVNEMYIVRQSYDAIKLSDGTEFSICAKRRKSVSEQYIRHLSDEI